MPNGEPLIDKIERLLFGASAPEMVDMRLRLAERRIEQRIVAALEATEADVTDTANEGGDSGDNSDAT